jgi:ubiquinone/menaquinone biosynthesis C-methylase UbiE
MWTEALKGQMLAPPDPDSNIGANLQIYNAISDDYMKHTRQLNENALRIRDGAARILALQEQDTPHLHLDFGCGPGQVIGWLKNENLLSVGLDVSLVNLRNTRKATGALVVCGDATRMPFKPAQFDLVTEASVLHHILDWRSTVQEACRVCQQGGGILLDAEPSREMVAFSKLAVFVFDLRFPVYKLLSYVRKNKYIFRDTEQAKLNLKAEIHHQPGTGFPLDELTRLFNQAGYHLHLYHSPGAALDTRKPPKIKNMILNLLSFRNPWNPKLGSFTAIGNNSPTRPEKRQLKPAIPINDIQSN